MITSPTKAVPLASGYDDPGIESQTAFRAMMDALARPGTIIPLASTLTPPPCPAHPRFGRLGVDGAGFRSHLLAVPCLGGARKRGALSHLSYRREKGQ